MKRKVQLDWMDFFFRKPINVVFAGNNQYAETLMDLRYKLQTDNGEKTKAMGTASAATIDGETRRQVQGVR